MREFVQAGKKRPYFTEQEIDEICSTELSKHGLLPSDPSPIRIERLVEKKYGFSCIPGDVPEGVLGFTRFGQNGPEQIVTAPHLEGDDVVTLRRLRTTLAHEVGHCLLHAHIFVTSKSPKTFCRDTENNTYNGEWWEWQANRAMGSLLIPRSLLEKALKPFISDGGLLDTKQRQIANIEEAIKALSDTFDVNPIVARYRLEAYKI